MPTSDPPAIENTKFQTQYVKNREDSGVGIEISQEKKVQTVPEFFFAFPLIFISLPLDGVFLVLFPLSENYCRFTD